MYVCYSSQFCLLFCFHFVSFSLVCLTFYILDFPSDPLDFTNFFCCCWLRLVFNNLVASVVVNTRQQLWPPALCLGEMLWRKTCLRMYVCTYIYVYVCIYGCVYMPSSHSSACLPMQLRVVLKWKEMKIFEFWFGKPTKSAGNSYTY